MDEIPESRERATIASAVGAFLALPLIVAFVLPLTLVAGDPEAGFTPWGLLGTALGVWVLGSTVREFFTQGRGTLAPWNPPRRLVTTGLFARCRNPMYVGVVATILGHAWTFQCARVAIYGVAMWVVFHVRVCWHEEPWAARSFPDAWPAYRARVPRWMPRRPAPGER